MTAGPRIAFDMRDFERLHNLMGAAGAQTPFIARRAVSRTLTMARTAMVRPMVRQTGLKARTIRKAMVTSATSNHALARGAGLSGEIYARGGDVRLKFFAARETRKGVSAAPRGQRSVFGGTFTKGGRFPKRVSLRFGGEVLRRVGSGRGPLRTVKSGVFIAQEMVTGASMDAFFTTASTVLPRRLEHELLRALGG